MTEKPEAVRLLDRLLEQPQGRNRTTGAGGGAYAGGRDAFAAATPTAIPAVAPTTAPAARVGSAPYPSAIP